MKTRAFVFSAMAFASLGIATFAGCGGDDSTATSDDAGPDTTSDTTLDTSLPDTSGRGDVVGDRGPELTGQSCKAPADCYPALDAASLKGQVACLTQVTNGYCTHECTKDEDCCAVPGECKTGLKEVCASFESTAAKYCFISCEPADITSAADAGLDAGTSGDEFCAHQASTDFSCRSTGGGNQNRKACLPAGAPGDGGPRDGAADADAADAADADGG